MILRISSLKGSWILRIFEEDRMLMLSPRRHGSLVVHGVQGDLLLRGSLVVHGVQGDLFEDELR